MKRLTRRQLQIIPDLNLKLSLPQLTTEPFTARARSSYRLLCVGIKSVFHELLSPNSQLVPTRCRVLGLYTPPKFIYLSVSRTRFCCFPIRFRDFWSASLESLPKPFGRGLSTPFFLAHSLRFDRELSVVAKQEDNNGLRFM